MGNVAYSVNERVRRGIKIALIAVFLIGLVSPFFLFSNYGSNYIHDWAVKKDKPGGLYFSANLHRIMGTLSPERYPKAQAFYEEFIEKYPSHVDVSYAQFYIGICLEEQKKFGAAKLQYEYFVETYPTHEKVTTAEKALNRIEAFGIYTGDEDR